MSTYVSAYVTYYHMVLDVGVGVFSMKQVNEQYWHRCIISLVDNYIFSLFYFCGRCCPFWIVLPEQL